MLSTCSHTRCTNPLPLYLHSRKNGCYKRYSYRWCFLPASYAQAARADCSSFMQELMPCRWIRHRREGWNLEEWDKNLIHTKQHSIIYMSNSFVQLICSNLIRCLIYLFDLWRICIGSIAKDLHDAESGRKLTSFAACTSDAIGKLRRKLQCTFATWKNATLDESRCHVSRIPDHVFVPTFCVPASIGGIPSAPRMPWSHPLMTWEHWSKSRWCHGVHDSVSWMRELKHMGTVTSPTPTRNVSGRPRL